MKMQITYYRLRVEDWQNTFLFLGHIEPWLFKLSASAAVGKKTMPDEIELLFGIQVEPDVFDEASLKDILFAFDSRLMEESLVQIKDPYKG